MKLKIALYLFLYKLRNNYYILTHKFDKHTNILSNKEHKYKFKKHYLKMVLKLKLLPMKIILMIT